MLRFFLVFFLVTFFLLEGSHAEIDSTVTEIQLRHFDKIALDKYKTDNDFNYQTALPEQSNIFSLILHYIGKFLHKILGTQGEVTTGKIIFYGLMIGALVMLILNLLGVDIRFLFGRKSQVLIQHELVEENIKEMNLDDLIQQAIENKQWKLCLRYQYLKALRLLTDKQLINWKPGKTNMEYYYELDAQNLKMPFLDLTDLFETVWYGGYNFQSEEYLRNKQNFENFYNSVNKITA